MDEDEMYDEFGNYIGDNGSSQSEDKIEEEDEINYEVEEKEEERVVKYNNIDETRQYRTHEDVQYYKPAQEVYGGAEIKVQLEDTQDITIPIVEVMKEVKKKDEKEECIYDLDFMKQMNIMLAGDLHSGKSGLLTRLVQKVHLKKSEDDNYSDFTKHEKERCISINSVPFSFILENSKGKNYLINCMDTPGHTNFSDEVSHAMAISDGCVLVVDVVEGIGLNSLNIIKHVVKNSLNLVVCINKLDRLIIELKLPPNDAYLKIKLVLEHINSTVQENAQLYSKSYPFLSPLNNNVIFASTKYNILFNINTFVLKYNQPVLSQLLYGDIYYNPNTKKFNKSPTNTEQQRTFVEFILNPIYKLFSSVVSETQENLQKILSSLQIYLKKQEYQLDIQEILKIVFNQYLNKSEAFIESISESVVDTEKGNIIKLKGQYNDDLVKKIIDEDILVIQIVKQYMRQGKKEFDILGRVMNGKVVKNEKVKILGEHYSLEDEEDMYIGSVSDIMIYQGRYWLEVEKGFSGNWLLFNKLDQIIVKSATIINPHFQLTPFRPIQYYNHSLCKIAIEPVIPSELPKMLDGIRNLNKTYPILKTKVEESGEHILLGTGELYLDNILYHLREVYSNIEIKVSDPCVTFSETVIETSSIKCTATSNNGQNKISILAQPLEKEIQEQIEEGFLQISNPQLLSDKLRREFKWDILASRSVWAFGPDTQGPNVLLDDTLPSECNKALLMKTKEAIIQGFQWSTREGPLCEEPIRNVQFKIIESILSENQVMRGGGQLIPMVRRVAHQSLLMASPRMMEPVNLVEIVCIQEAIEGIYQILNRRRAHVISELPKPATQLFIIRAHVPLIDTFGLETDLRLNTFGQAFITQIFHHWLTLLADPLDKQIVLTPLQPSQPSQLAREFMIKTRKRKGLNQEVSILKYFDDPKIIDALKQDQDYQQYF